MLLLSAAIIIGAILLLHFHERYAFRQTDGYTRVVLWASLLCTPFVLYFMRASSFEKQVAKRYPTTWLRTFVVMPLMTFAGLGLVLTAPLGWLFAATAWSNDAVQHVSATAIEVGAYAQRKGCNQSATLRFASTDKRTCLDTLYPPSTMHEAQLLDIGIVTSRFGFLIVSISADATARPK